MAYRNTSTKNTKGSYETLATYLDSTQTKETEDLAKALGAKDSMRAEEAKVKTTKAEFISAF